MATNKKTRAVPLAAVIGSQLRLMRDATEVTQEQVADAARQVGLPWARSSVAALETGARELSASELLLLPEVCHLAFGDDLSLADLLPSTGLAPEVIDLGGAPVDGEEVRDLLSGRSVVDVLRDREPRGIARRIFERGKLGYGEAEMKAARKFGVPASDVDRAARKLWRGRTLTAERDRRVEERKEPDATPRQVQALRAHATRALLDELEPRIRQSRKG